jgi:hypothetical protein
MQMNESDEHWAKACVSIRDSSELQSNVILERRSHEQKEPQPMMSTDEGMQIDESD